MEAARFLAQVRARLRRAVLLEGTARILVLIIGLLAVVVSADYLWPTPGWFRLAALLAVLGALGWGIRVRLTRPLTRAMDDRALAQFAERRLGGLDGRLLSAIDGIPLLGEAMVMDAALTAEAARSLVPASTLPRWLAGAGAALTGVLLIGVIFPRFAHDACGRLFLPLGTTQWARGTTLQGHGDPEVVASDRKASVIIERHHYRSGEEDPQFQAPVVMSWEALDGVSAGRHDARQLPGLRGNAWQAALPALSPGHWRIVVESGDAVPVQLEVQSVARPVLASLTATLLPPAYTHLPAQHLTTLACNALPGSHLDFTVAFSADVDRHITTASGEVHLPTGTRDLELKPGGSTFSSRLTIAPGAALEVVLHAQDQDGIAVDPPPTFTITPAEDRPPAVSLSGPSSNETVTTHAVVALTVDASDDLALARLELHGQVQPLRSGAGPDAPPSPSIPVKTLTTFTDARGSAATTRHTPVDVSALAAIGEQIVLTGWASDANDVTGPGITTSTPILLRVVSDEALRQELDRLLAEARERASQAREEIGAGLAKPSKLAASARSAALAAGKCGDLVSQVVRRWSENRLPPEQIAPAVQAGELLHGQVRPSLDTAAGDGAEAPARAADIALAKVEKLLGSLLQEGDLTRRLADLIAKQEHLNEESRAFVLEHLTTTLDEAAKTHQASIAERQRGVAEDMKDLERQVLAGTAPQLADARALVHEQPVGDHLSEAADQVASEQERSKAVETQTTALAAMRKLLEALRGGDAAGDLADRIGEVAARQEAVLKELAGGKRPQELAALEHELHDAVQRLKPEVQSKDEQAGKAVAAAEAAAEAAQGDMQKGDAESASREASTAASLLREAQKRLSSDNQPDKDKKDEKRSTDVVALLRELLSLQTQLVADATLIHLQIGEKALDFAAGRSVSGLAQRQSDLLLRLREEGLKPLEAQPIATVALQRVATAMQKAQEHLQTPALGSKGMRLEKIALAELSRLVDIADAPPPPSSSDGSGGGNGNQSPFPAQAELALLAAMQQELSWLTAADRPTDIAKGQADLRDLVESLEKTTRPGTRPNVLLSRARRAMASAAAQLSSKDRGLLTRHEQVDAEGELRRMIAESAGGGGGGGGSGAQPRGPRQQRQPNQPSPSPSAKSGGAGGASPASGAKAGGRKGSDPTVVTAEQTSRGIRLDLPEERREQLKQAREQNLAPRAMQLYERYLELLEDKP